jgi:spermidine synthase
MRMIAVLAAGWAMTRAPVTTHRIGPRLLEDRVGHEAEYRVFDRDGARYLLADGTIHTVIDTLSGDCMQRAPAALELLRILKPGRDSMLVLGLRGGALPLAFARSGWHVTVVEPDTDAVAVSRSVSYKPGELPLVAMDPRVFLRGDATQRSVIVVDAFGGSSMPYPLCTREFVTQLAEHLQESGLLVYVVEAHGWGDPLVGSLGATLRTRFAHVVALPTSEPQTALGTILLLASHGPVNLTDEQLPNPVTFFQNPDALWRSQQLTHAWLNRYAPQPAAAAVLTDDRSMVEVWSDRINHAERAELHQFFGPDGGSW